MIRNRKQEDRSVIALLYDEYKRMYPEVIEEMQREIEELYQHMYHRRLDVPEEVTLLVNAMCDDRARYAYEAGVRCGVHLAVDLELDSLMSGGGADVCDC